MRLHFASIGHRDARLSPLTLDLRDENHGTGVDTVLWLRNGGGKSSILNLFFSLLRPGARDFLGSAAEGKSRRLADYVKDNDLAYVVSEWDLAPRLDLLGSAPTHIHVLGQVLSWKGLQRSPDESKLRKLLFSFHAGAGLGFDDLPIRGLGEPVGSFEAFREWLAGHKSRSPAQQVFYTDAPSTWRAHLGQLGLDPDLMKVQVEMNTREGAADESFRFHDARAFVDFFLQLAMDLDKASELSANLETFRSKLQQRPVLLLERQLFDAALPPLRELSAAVDAREAAHRHLGEVTDAASGTAAALRQRADSFERRAAERRASQQDAQEKARLAGNEADLKRRWASGVERHAIRLRAREAEDALARARAIEADRQRAVHTVEAAGTLSQVESLAAQVAAKQVALDRSTQALVPLKESLEHAGSRLRLALRRSDELLAGHEQEAATLHRGCKATEQALRDEQSRADTRAGGLAAEIRGHRQHLKDREHAREALGRDGVLAPYERAEDALARWQEAAARAAARARQAGERHEQRTRERQELAATLRPLGEERGRVEAQAKAARTTLDQAIGWRDRLRRTPILGEVQGVDEADLEQPRLETLLRQQAEAARRRILELGVDAAEDERALAALRSDGFLPPTRDVEEVVRSLRERKVAAHAGLRYLAENHSSAESREHIARDPARHAGVVVLRQEDLTVARTLQTLDMRLRTPIQVTWVRADDPTDGAACVLPPDPATFDRAAADARRHELTEMSEARRRESDDLHRREHACNAAADELARWLAAWGGGKLEAHESLLGSLVRHAQQLAEQIADVEANLARLAADIQAAADERRTADAEAAAAKQHAGRVAAFIEQYDRHFQAWTDELDRLQRESDALGRRRDELADLITQAGERTHEAQRRLDELGHQRRAIRRQIDAILYRAADEPDDAPTVAEAEALYDQLRASYEQKTSENRLQWELDQLQQALLGVRAAYTQHLARGLDEPEIRRALARGDLPGQLARGQAALADAVRDHARAANTHEIAQKAATELQRKRDADDVPTDGRPLPTTSRDADALALQLRDEALTASAEHERRRGEAQQHDEAAKQLATRRAAHANVLDLLIAVAGELAERPPRDLPDDDDAVRSAVTDLCARLKDARAADERTAQRVRSCGEAVRSIAAEERFASLKNQARDRLRTDVAELAADAAKFADEFEKAREILGAAIAELDDHRRILITNLIGLGEDAAHVLRQAARASVLPESLGPWGGRSYLRVDFQIPDGDADKQARIAPLIDRLMDAATVPNALNLVRQAIFELVGGRHDAFKVTVLKPDAVLRPDAIPVELLSTFSRGQQLTAAILLYCTIVQIRARRRGRGRAVADAGTLILDNPIGTCSSRALLEMQRTIAQKMGVQLVYTTGVEDADAIAVLPNTIRLRNSHRDRRTGDLHVTEDADPVEAVRLHARTA
ncbi:MAG: hypothetical protein JNL82_04420 [Myxococcales bacterium]|nr:hypothetical protein [Myxococcales bacterium]